MNVCFLSEAFRYGGGIERVASILMNALSQENWCEVYSLTYTPNDTNSYNLSYRIHQSYLLENHITMKRAILSEHIIQKLKKYLKYNNIEVLIACGDLFFPISVLSKSKKCKVICWDHTNPLINSDQKFQRISRKFGFKMSDANVVLTRSALNIINSQNYKTSKNYHIYNPIDPYLLVSHYYNSESKKIISVGRLDYAKNFDRLLDIANRVFQHECAKDWTWDIYGNGDELNSLLLKRDKLHLQDKVDFKGHSNNIYELYSEYSFYVMTSRYEGQPMTLLEAMAMGLPLISFDILTGPNEIIVNNENGFLCNKQSDEEMVSKILYLIENKDERIRLAANSQKNIDLFEIGRIVNEWKKLLTGLK